jgi:hypothetical protein
MVSRVGQNRIDGCDCWGSDGRLDTKNNHIDLCHIFMLYSSYDIICHIMKNDAYDIEIWHKAIWSILVSKQPAGPQQLHLFSQFWLINSLQIKNGKTRLEIFSLYKFWKSFVFFAKTKIGAVFSILVKSCFWKTFLVYISIINNNTTQT